MKGDQPKLETQPKVVAQYVQPGKGLTPEKMEALREQQQRAEDQAKIERIKQVGRSKLSKILQAKMYVIEWTHPCLKLPDVFQQLSVDEYYPDEKLGVDKRYTYDEADMALCEKKRVAMNAAGFRYIVLHPDKDWADAQVELESQVVAV